MGDGRTLLIACLALMVLSTGGLAQTAEPSASKSDGLIAAARDIMAAAPLAALVTIGEDGSPSVRMMDALQPDGMMIVRLGTNASSRKVREIRKNPRVALYYAEEEGPGYVTIKGMARVVTDETETTRHWQERWGEFYLPDRSNFVVIEVRPERIEVVSYRHGIVSTSESWEVPAVALKPQAE